MTSEIGFPELTRDEVFMIATRRLWLRWPRVADASAIAAFAGHPEVASRTASWPVGADAAFAASRIAKTRAKNADGSGFAFAVAERGHWHDAVGFMGLAVEADGSGYLGYHFAPAVWGRGYASEALAALIDMTRLLTRIPLLKASVMPDNPASVRVLEKCGFRRTGDGEVKSAYRGMIAVEHYARELRGSGRNVGGRAATQTATLEMAAS